MGLSIKDIIPKKEIEISDLSGKTICVDAFNTLYQFLTTIRQQDGTPLMDSKKRITSHLSGIFYRNIKLLSEGIKLIYVFDGKAPKLKCKTHINRAEHKKEAREKYEQAKKSDNISEMKKYSSSLTKLDDEIISESKELLKAMGIAVVQAPSEGEAEASHLTRTHKEIFSVASQDYDSLLFGTPRLLQNLTLAKKRKTQYGWVEVRLQLIELDRVLNELEINLDQLICLGILVGTDYNPKGIPGIGQKKALDIVRKYKQPVLIFKNLEEQLMSIPEKDRFDWQEIFHIFHHHSVKDEEIEFPKINEEKIKKILVENHDFSQERVNKQLDKLRNLEKQKKQKGLDEWF